MSDDLARARAREAACRFMLNKWPNGESSFNRDDMIAAFVEGYLDRLCVDVLSGDELALTATVLDAASRGEPFTKSDAARAAKATLVARDRIERLIKGQAALSDQRAIEQATGQRQLDDATALMTEARDLFFEYERHHRAKIERFPGRPDVPEHVAAFKVLKAKADRNALMAARLDAWLAGEDAYPVSLNPAEALRQISESMVDGETIKGVDHESFDRAAAYLDQPVLMMAPETGPGLQDFPSDHIMPPPTPDSPVIPEGPEIPKSPPFASATPDHMRPIRVSPLVAAMTASIDEISSLPVAPAQSLAEERAAHAALCGFTYWPGGSGPPADLDPDGEVLLDWGPDSESGPRFTICGVEELSPTPGLWAESVDFSSFATIIGYRGDPDADEHPVEADGYLAIDHGPAEHPTPADAIAHGKTPRILVADQPDPLVALVHARNWLISAESLIAEAAEFIRGVTGANPGSDSADLCQRLDAWLTPMATRPADEGAEKEARRSSATHQGDNHG